MDESNSQKSQANRLFTSSRYSEAIGEYDKALSSCPNYFDYEIAVLKSNISACHLKLEDWKAAVDSATASLECLERLQPTKATKGKETGAEETGNNVVEIEGEGEEAEKELADLKLSDERKEDIRRIRAKALMRRAKGKMEQGGWGNLAGAEEGELAFHFLAKYILILSRLQRTIKNVEFASARPEGGASGFTNTACEGQCCEGQGDGRDDGKAERGRVFRFPASVLPS